MIPIDPVNAVDPVDPSNLFDPLDPSSRSSRSNRCSRSSRSNRLRRSSWPKGLSEVGHPRCSALAPGQPPVPRTCAASVSLYLSVCVGVCVCVCAQESARGRDRPNGYNSKKETAKNSRSCCKAIFSRGRRCHAEGVLNKFVQKYINTYVCMSPVRLQDAPDHVAFAALRHDGLDWQKKG